jgi:hypothetical protein
MQITWIDGLGNVLGNGLEYIVEALPDGRRFTAKSILKLTPKKEHHNTTFTCQAQNTADRTYRSAKLKLEVKYAPKVTLSIISGLGPTGRLTEGAEVRLACKADANPLDLTYRWYINDDLVPGDYTTELIIPNITRKYHDAIVKCEVHNPVGKSEESETLDISCKWHYTRYLKCIVSLITKVRSPLSSGLSLHVICHIFTDISNKPAASTYIKDGSSRFLRNVDNYIPHPTSKSQTSL